MSPSALLDDETSPVRTLPLSYDARDSENSARNLIFALIPEWQHADGPVEFVRFKDGITNTLFKAIKRRPGHSDQQIDKEAILLRAYGNGTAVLIDRDREAASHTLLARRKLAPELLARFNNGLLYRYIEGTPCTPEDLRKSDIYRATARRMGEWHGVLPVAEAIAGSDPQESAFANIKELVPGKPIPNLWTVAQRWILSLPNDTDEHRARNSMLQHELEFMTGLLGDVRGLDRGNYILSHCDLLSGNVIVHPRLDGAKNEVSFIDYEYATPAPAAFDLANHFAEWAGFDCDFSVLPTRSQRKEFLREYVQSFRSYIKAPDTNGHGKSHAANGTSHSSEDEDVDNLFDEVDRFRGMPGLFWGVWGLIQATISDIDFDYASYADTRLGEYWAWKAEHQGTRKTDGKEVPLRERRWAEE